MKLNPLELPEVVSRVGLYIPLFVPCKALGGRANYESRHLVAAIKVCRLWHAVLTPILWTVWDGYYMHCQNFSEPPGEHDASVPTEVLRANSHHLRYADLLSTIPPGILQATQLKEVYINGETYISNAEVLFSNPDLPYLHISFCGSSDDLNIVQPSLKSLSRLKVLMLSHADFTATDQLPQVLSKNSHLQELDLYHPWRLSTFDGCGPLSITYINFGGRWKGNMGIIQLIRQCPYLQILDVPGSDCPAAALAQSIRDCCPKLTFLKCELGHLREDDIELLIRAPTCLMKLHTSLHSFSAKVCDALLAHTDWIEEICLSFTDGVGEGVQSTNRILTLCPNLRRFKVSYKGISEHQDYGPVNIWQKEQWKCTKLESLHLNGLVRDWTSGSARVLQRHAEQEAKFHEKLFSHGWSVKTVPVTNPGLVQQLVAVRRYEVFRCIWGMEQMYKVYIEGYEYVHEDRMPINGW